MGNRHVWVGGPSGTEVTSTWLNEMENDIAAGLGPVVTKTASFTVSAAEDRKIIDANSASPMVVTLPTRASVPTLPADFQAEVSQRGTGQVSVAAASGVTIRTPPAPSGLKTRGRYSSLSIRRYDNPVVPLDTTNIVCRYKADSLTGADLSAVSSWAESSGAGLPAAVQATSANQPKLRVGALNGHNTVEFDGTNDFLSLSGSALALAQNAANLIVFIAYKLPVTTVTTGPRTLLSLSSGTSTAANRVTVQTHNASLFPIAGGRQLDANSLISVAGSSQLTTGKLGVLTGSFQWSANDLFLYDDGNLIASTLAFQAVGSTSNTPSLAGAIGANAVGGAEFFSGQIAEMIIVNAVDTPTVRANVHTYLYNTYGGTNVPSDYSALDEWVVTGDTVA